MIGKNISHYEITGLVGKGGMGEVYRARDTRLDREVALKILPRELSGDLERIARFQREARTLATLQHQNIASIYDFEDTGEQRFLVMELVEGEDLAERLQRDGALPVEDALRIAMQIAAGLEVAHEQGIVHRDLKPANVKIAPDGNAKVLDFGLARAIEGSDMEGDPALSPTITAAMTQPGTILGTAAYMSPEQARGRRVDKRSDIWSFGIILYEMLTGAPLFVGETITDTITGILHVTPDFDRLPASTPPHVRRMLARCLDKDPATRLRDIGEFRIALARGSGGQEERGAMPAERSAAPRVAWVLTIVAACAALALGWLYLGSRGPQSPREIRASIHPPTGEPLNWGGSNSGSLTISPDGTKMTFAVATEKGISELYLRSLDSEEAQPIAGTKGATFPFWSPDSRQLAYFVEGKLKKQDVGGGAPITIADAPEPRGGSWGPKGDILFTPSTQSPIMRVSSSGGPTEQITKLDPERGRETTHRHPWFLPDGNAFLYLRASHAANPSSPMNSIWIGYVDSDETTELFHATTNAVYAQGHVFWVDDNILMARPFEPSQARLIGDAFPVSNDILVQASHWRAVFAVSEAGPLAYQHGAEVAKNLAWLDRQGNELQKFTQEGLYGTIDISPSEELVAVAKSGDGGGQSDIWVIDLTRDTSSRITFDDGEDTYPVWSPDGERIVFQSSRSGSGDLYVRNSDGSGTAELLYQDEDVLEPTSWSPDGKYLLVSRARRGYDLAILDVETGELGEIDATDAESGWGRFSPDGNWIAYLSNEGGAFNLYLHRFQGGDGKWQLTNNGADWVLGWNAAGDEIFYLDLVQNLCSVKVDLRGRVTSERPQRMFSTNYGMTWDVSGDGQRFLFGLPVKQSEDLPPTLVIGWKGRR